LAAVVIDVSVMYKFSFVQKEFNVLNSIPNVGSKILRNLSIDGAVLHRLPSLVTTVAHCAAENPVLEVGMVTSFK
jgi:hypothetical protein